MNPVLLYTDTRRINDEQTTLANVVTTYQSIYNAIKAVGVTPTIADIDSLVQLSRRQSTSDFINSYVRGKLADAGAPYEINGVAITRTVFESMIALPDTSGILAALQPVWGGNAQRVFIRDAKAARIDLLSLVADAISAVAGANATIAGLFTYYTANDASATMATQLQAVCDALNTFNGANDGYYTKKIPSYMPNNYGYFESEIPGIAILDGDFVVSLVFIRKYEQIGTLNFAM